MLADDDNGTTHIAYENRKKTNPQELGQLFRLGDIGIIGISSGSHRDFTWAMGR